MAVFHVHRASARMALGNAQPADTDAAKARKRKRVDDSAEGRDATALPPWMARLISLQARTTPAVGQSASLGSAIAATRLTALLAVAGCTATDALPVSGLLSDKDGRTPELNMAALESRAVQMRRLLTDAAPLAAAAFAAPALAALLDPSIGVETTPETAKQAAAAVQATLLLQFSRSEPRRPDGWRAMEAARRQALRSFHALGRLGTPRFPCDRNSSVVSEGGPTERLRCSCVYIWQTARVSSELCCIWTRRCLLPTRLLQPLPS